MVLCLLFTSCDPSKPSLAVTELFDSVPVVQNMTIIIPEASGIAASKLNPGNIWVEQDSGNPNEILLLSSDGAVKSSVVLKNAVNRDWEEIAISGDSLYVADIGDNAEAYPDYVIYILPEPLSSAGSVLPTRAIHFKYPDKSHDAEAIFLDPLSHDIYLITKRDNPSLLYKIAFPYSDTMNVCIKVGELQFPGVVGASLAANGNELIVKTYDKLYYYKRNTNQTFPAVLSGMGTQIPYKPEPQGEAVCFSENDSGYFTLSEQPSGSGQKLYFYKRK